MKKSIRLLLAILIIGVMVLAVLPLPVQAINQPDDPPGVNAVYIYEDLLDVGDVGVLIDYFIDYTIAGIPTEPVTDAYLAIFIDTDGITQLKSVAPYTFQDNGYGRGLVWIYFSPAEVTTYSLDAVDVALYRIWLVGNPAIESGWTGDPPKTVATIDTWYTTGDPNVLLALRVLTYADLLELVWTPSVDLIQNTALGSKLTTLGESYFENVIQNLRQMASGAFASGELTPTQEDLDYSTEFGATMTNGTGTVVGSPITLVEGVNTVNVTVIGTFILALTKGTEGTAESVGGGGTVTGSPVALVWGTNTIDVSGIGNILITVNKVDTSTHLWDTISGTGFDMTTIAAEFGLSRWMFSGIVWMLLAVVLCAGVYRMSDRDGIGASAGGTGKGVLFVFDLWIIGGTLLGLLHPLVAILMFIAFGVFTGFVLFYKPANI